MKLSGIGGQAVIEGVMMRNKDKYSVAVRTVDNKIAVIKRQCKSSEDRSGIAKLPIIRGVVNFVDSLVLGISTLTYSSNFYENPKEQEPTVVDNVAKTFFKEKLDSVVMAITILFSVALALILFMAAPYFISRMLSSFVGNQWVLNLIEGIVRVLIFVLYLFLISLMKDIKRTFMYHGAEHKCINCIENGMSLTVENVRNSSREHKRCGTSFLFIVMLISVIFFIFIRLQSPFLQILVRLILVPVIAGVSYEVIRWAGKSNSKAVMIVSKPGMWLQQLTTREPDDDMIEVAIKAVDAIFDWRGFLDDYYADVADEDIPEEAYYYEAGEEPEENEYADDYEDDENYYAAEESEDYEYESDERYESEEYSDDDYSDLDDSEFETGDYGSEYAMVAMSDEDYDTSAKENGQSVEENGNSVETTYSEFAMTMEKNLEKTEDIENKNNEDKGYEFVEEEEDDDVGVDVPIFKQKNTQVEEYDRKRKRKRRFF